MTKSFITGSNEQHCKVQSIVVVSISMMTVVERLKEGIVKD